MGFTRKLQYSITMLQGVQFWGTHFGQGRACIHSAHKWFEYCHYAWIYRQRVSIPMNPHAACCQYWGRTRMRTSIYESIGKPLWNSPSLELLSGRTARGSGWRGAKQSWPLLVVINMRNSFRFYIYSNHFNIYQQSTVPKTTPYQHLQKYTRASASSVLAPWAAAFIDYVIIHSFEMHACQYW